jgi:hypothetical protein
VLKITGPGNVCNSESSEYLNIWHKPEYMQVVGFEVFTVVTKENTVF